MPRNQGTSRKGKPAKHDREAGMGKALQRAQGQRYRPKANGRRAQGGGGMGMQVGVASIGGGDGNGGVGMGGGDHKNPRSVLEMRDLDEFLHQADLANQEFKSEKEGLVVLDATGQVYRPAITPSVRWADESGGEASPPDFTFTELCVPRRPAWDESTTPQELQAKEELAFLEWRRAIAYKEEELLRQQQMQQQKQPHQLIQDTTTATPFEKNLQVWRQLWRVLERSSCLLQLVDARNPLFYLSHDLRDYAQVSLGKPMMVLVNKSDYLSAKQRAQWHEYLTKKEGWDCVVFFSAATEQAKLDQQAQEKRVQAALYRATVHDAVIMSREKEEEEGNAEDDNDDGDGGNSHPEDELSAAPQSSHRKSNNSSNTDGIGIDAPLNRLELLQAMKQFASRHGCQPDARYDNRIQFGMVGFPNVGKSSVINVLMGNSKHTHGLVRVGVAAQPGKTKHFQTLLLPDDDEEEDENDDDDDCESDDDDDDDNNNKDDYNKTNKNDKQRIMLCDCPGLVFPSFVSNTADLIAAGVYPIAQMRNHFWPVIQLICQRIPREILNAQYGIQLPIPTSLVEVEQNPQQLPQPTGEEFLTTLCEARGMMAAASGVPDFSRAARMVIQDYATGKLLYCHAPPEALDGNDNENRAVFYRETVKTALERTEKLRIKLAVKQEQQNKQHDKPQGTSVIAAPVLKSNHAATNVLEDLPSEDEGEEEEDDDDDDDTSSSSHGAVDDNLIELLANGATIPANNQPTITNTASLLAPPSRRSKRRGGRKKKHRQEDPYGCHETPSDNVRDLMDSMLLEDNNNPNAVSLSLSSNAAAAAAAASLHARYRQHKGVTVNAGKYGTKNYTRPTGPGFTTPTTA